MKILNDWKFIIMFCLTLGLAPYFPEPHIWGKVKWIWGGAVGMQTMDWFDTFFHGMPWLLLIRFFTIKFLYHKKELVQQKLNSNNILG